MFEARLTAEYFEARTARNGPQALHVCARERADVVLLDVMMPGMDGFEVCRRLKADPRTQHIPVIIITALDQPSDRVKGLEAGADDFLTKPVDDIALITRVKNLARLKMLTDEMLMRASTEEQMGFAATVGLSLTANHQDQIRRLSIFIHAAPGLEVSPERLTLRVYNGSHFIVLSEGTD